MELRKGLVMVAWLKQRAGFVLVVGGGLSLLGVGLMVGMIATLATLGSDSRSTLSELPLYATATDTGSSMSMATGPIDDEVEGVFFLDFLTGELAGVVVASRKPNMINGIFKTNVIKDLGVEADKKPDYLMTTGAATFVGQSGQQQPGRCVVYVLDQNTGNFAGYGFTWNKTFASSLRQQTGAFIKLISANARAQKVQE
jgi:hypothetical protein